MGGFATVWLYHDAELRSDVAVKALAENWAQRLDVRERFLEEARILRQADSDHIVRVYDIGEVDGTPYFVMTYADLGSLADVLERERVLPVPTVLDLVGQAGAGLSVLHEHGVVHRDIKPQNLLLRSGGSAGPRLLVADLGVAKAMLHASGLTQVVGTPAYMAPEQATGEGVDARADVHALGAVAYQMLTGRLVREGGLGDLIDARLPEPPSRLAPLPPAVDDVLLRAIDPDRERRWPDVTAFARELRLALLPEGSGVSPTVLRSPVPPPASAAGPKADPVPAPAPEPPAARGSLGTGVLLLVCLVVLAATFGLSYLAVTLLR